MRFDGLKLLFIFLLFGLLLPGCANPPALAKLSPDAVILAFGDSLTYGTGAQREEAYPAVLSVLTGHPVINAGVPGEVTALGLARLPALLDEVQPELLILCHGGNDILRKISLKKTKRNIRRMVDLARARGISVLLLAVPQPGLWLSPPDMYAQVADAAAVPLAMHVLSEVLADSALKSDRIHPNSEGYQRIAHAVHGLMQRAGAL